MLNTRIVSATPRHSAPEIDTFNAGRTRMSNSHPHQFFSLPQAGALLSRPALGAAFALLATVLWSFNFIAGRGFVNAIPPMTLVALRAFIALLILIPFAWGQLRRDWAAIRAHMGYLALISLLGMGLPQTLIYMAAYTSPALNMSIISISTPLFVLLLARILYGERLNTVQMVGLGVTIAGIVVLISRGNPAVLLGMHFQPGDLLMLGNAAGFAVYTLLLRKRPGNIGSLSFLAVFTALGMLIVTPGAVWELAGSKPIVFTPMLIGGILYTSIGATLLAFGFWSAAVRYAGSSRASIIYYSMPLFSGIEAAVFLGEPLLAVHGVSMLLIVAGLFLALHVTKGSATAQKQTT